MSDDIQVKELGNISGDMLLFGGPYSNLQATRALFACAEAASIPDSNLICTGDVVAYCGDPVATTAMLRGRDITVVAGNCEKQLAENALDCGCGFEDGSACDLLSAGWYAYANAAVGTEDRAWMGRCPDVVTFNQSGRRFAVIHGGITDVAKFLWSNSPDMEFLHEINFLKDSVGPFDAVISGHCGIPFISKVAGIDWINAGVIGMPPHDGASDTRYVQLSGGVATIKSLTYDAQAAQARMQEVGLTQGYHSALTSGIWPSEDILPPDLHR